MPHFPHALVLIKNYNNLTADKINDIYQKHILICPYNEGMMVHIYFTFLYELNLFLSKEYDFSYITSRTKYILDYKGIAHTRRYSNIFIYNC